MYTKYLNTKMDCVAFDLSDLLPNFWSKQLKKREQRTKL